VDNNACGRIGIRCKAADPGGLSLPSTKGPKKVLLVFCRSPPRTDRTKCETSCEKMRAWFTPQFGVRTLQLQDKRLLGGTNWLSFPYKRLWKRYWQTSAIPFAF